MNELISRSNNTITSREIAELTGREHKNVMRDIRVLLDQGVSQLNFEPSEYTNDRGKIYECYKLTKKGCLILASGYDAVLREKIINRWEELEVANQYKLPQTFAEALMLAAKQAEELELKEKALEAAKPKVEFYDTVTGSSETIDMRTVATVLNMGVGRNKIFEILREEKVLDRKNMPYQSYIDRGYFRTIESTYCKPDGTTCINIKTVVFQRGLDYIRKLIIKNK